MAHEFVLRNGFISLQNSQIQGVLDVSQNVNALKFVMYNGTSEQILLADGTVTTFNDSRNYAFSTVNINGTTNLAADNNLDTLTLNNGTGINITGSSSGNTMTIGHSNVIIAGTVSGASGDLNFGSSFTLPTVTWDTEGHITNYGTTTVNLGTYAISAISGATIGDAVIRLVSTTPATIDDINLKGGNEITITRNSDSEIEFSTPTYTGDFGIDVTNHVVSHTNNVIAGTAKGTSGGTLTYAGTFNIPNITYDSQGHITEWGVNTLTLPNDIHVSSLAWNDGTTSGPTVTLSYSHDINPYTSPAIPTASATVSGVVTTGAQTFGGDKTFANDVTVGQDLTVIGNLVVSGTTITVESTIMTVSDNIIVVNQGETGDGVSLGSAGLRVDRGTLSDYLFVFDEVRDAFVIGTSTDETTPNIANLQVVATREDDPINKGVAYWSDTDMQFLTDSDFIWTSGATSGGTLDIVGVINATELNGSLNGTDIDRGVVAIAHGGTGLSTAPTNGQLLIGKSDGSYSVATLTEGSGIDITNGNGTITIANSLATNSERGGIQIGYTAISGNTETQRPVLLSNEKAYIELPRQITAVTLNGSASQTTLNIYAPITSGNAGEILQSNGTGVAPTYTNSPSVNSISIDNSDVKISAASGITTSGATIAIASVPITDCTGIFFDYVAINGVNRRIGTVLGVHNGNTNAEYTDVSSVDLGNTLPLTLTVNVTSGNLTLWAASTSGSWTIKVTIRQL